MKKTTAKSKEQVSEMKRLRAGGMTLEAVAAAVNVSPATVAKYVNASKPSKAKLAQEALEKANGHSGPIGWRVEYGCAGKGRKTQEFTDKAAALRRVGELSARGTKHVRLLGEYAYEFTATIKGE